MSVMASRPLVRWVVPVGVLAAVVGGVAIGAAVGASAEASPPPRSPAQLLVDLQTARLDGASGTVVERADLGLPSVPDSIGGDGSANLNSLVTGAHTLRVWYSGPDKTRVALLGAMGESDIIRNGADVWIWSSTANTAEHQTLPSDAVHGTGPTDVPSTPQQAADDLLATLDPTTTVSVDQSTTVAGRAAYQLVLTPKDTNSLVAKATIAIDGTRHVPLRVQVYAKGYSSPAFQIGFTDVNFTRPDNSRFEFTPPAGTTVTDGKTPASQLPGTGALLDPSKTAVIGTGWTSVLVARADLSQATTGSDQSRRGSASLLSVLPEVNGSWGSGRLLRTHLFSALITDDGRILVGAVSGQRLLDVAGDPAAALK